MSVSEPASDEHSPNESLQQEQLEASEQEQVHKFGTFGGVFTPTLLTILGVILFLRVGWVVGNAGLLGAILIITISFVISTCTALAMSSITTNIRIGAGGAYAVIAQSLGLEVGGAVGIPRYLSQALAVTMYIFGFREGWRFLFENHDPLWIDLAAFLALFIIAYISADLAIKTQYIIMTIIVGSIISIVVAAATGSMEYTLAEVPMWGEFKGAPETGFEGTTFWIVFSVFFPATTGIMAGANMSGDLKNPKQSIPSGTLWAIGVSFVIYILLAIWLAFSASTEELLNNYTVAMDEAYWPSAVLAGLLGATFSSALASLVGSARILQAMGEHHLVPEDDWLAEVSDNAEPRHAMLVTGGLILLTIMLRDLNAVAPLITMFFLVTYAVICGAVLIEQSLDMVSFRPLLRVPIWVSLLGFLSAIITMFIINPTISLISIIITVGFYVFLTGRELEAPFEDVRSGLFDAVAQWAAEQVVELPEANERAWKPTLLVPTDDVREVPGSFEFLTDLTKPNGNIELTGFTKDWTHFDQQDLLEKNSRRFRKRGLFSRWALIEAEDFREGAIKSMILSGGFFGPNLLYLHLPNHDRQDADYRAILQKVRHFSLGCYLFVKPENWINGGDFINVWVSDMSPDWDPDDLPVSLDLSLLSAYILRNNWDANVRVISAIREPDTRKHGERFLTNYLDQARLPNVDVHLIPEDFDQALEQAPDSDLELFGLSGEDDDFDGMRELVDRTGTACLFVKGSGEENALA